MYYVQDDITGNMIALLGLNGNQKIYFENMMQSSINLLCSKYEVCFTTEGIQINCGFANDTQEIEKDLNDINKSLAYIEKYESPSLSDFDTQLLNLKMPESSSSVLQILNRNHNILRVEGSIYCSQSDFESYSTDLESTLVQLKYKRSKAIYNLKSKAANYLDDINKLLAEFNCFAKFYLEKGKLLIYGVEISESALKIVNINSLEEEKEKEKEDKQVVSVTTKLQSDIKANEFIEKAYFVIQIRPNLIKFFIAPFYFNKLIKILENDISSTIDEENYKVASGNFKIMKSSKKLCLTIKNDCSTLEMIDDSKFLYAAQNIKNEMNQLLDSKTDEDQEHSKSKTDQKSYWWSFYANDGTETKYDQAMNSETEKMYCKFLQGGPGSFNFKNTYHSYLIEFSNTVKNKGIQTNIQTHKLRNIVRKEISASNKDYSKYEAKVLKIHPLK